jgi:hypothetical protein
MKEQFGVATVTNIGIQFGDNFYSCARAIRERWFEIAWNKGNCEINITYYLIDLSKIYLSVNISEDKEVCNVIVRQSESGEKLERYFVSIQKLKIIRNNKRSSVNNQV